MFAMIVESILGVRHGGPPPKQNLTPSSRFSVIISLLSSSFSLRSLTRLAATAVLCGAVALTPAIAFAQHILVPMDDDQSNHLKAYGLTFNALRGRYLLANSLRNPRFNDLRAGFWYAFAK